MSAFDDFVSHFKPPLPPRSDTLGGHIPNLDKLSRDDAGIVCQAQEKPKAQEKPNPYSIYNSEDKDKTTPLDGGDSAHRTGVAAFCNSAQDHQLLHLFERNAIMVRHPTQIPFNFDYWMNCSRDQLMGYSAGCWRAGKLDTTARLYKAHLDRHWFCQNTEDFNPVSAEHVQKKPPLTGVPDVLAPQNVMYLSVCAGVDAAYLDLLGQFSLQADIQIAADDGKTDITNLLLQCVVCGRLDLFVKVHPKYKDALVYYWATSRGGRSSSSGNSRTS
jgi:hypothetical protein